MKAKCEAGWRPNIAPIGYKNVMTYNRISYVEIDKERAPVIKQMFNRVANKGQSGRVVKLWLNQIGFTTRSGKSLALSKIYTTLKNPFYYGEFNFGGKIYKGNHEPLITKELFDKVQKQLIVPPKDWNKKIFPFRGLCKCGSCGEWVTAEEKYKKTKYDGVKKYIYYHCGRHVNYDCDEPYITEEDLIKQLIAHIDEIKLDEKLLTKQLMVEIERFHSLRGEVLHQEFLTGNLNQFDYPQKEPLDRDMAKDYLLHVLKAGSAEDRIKILTTIKTKFILHNKELILKTNLQL
jgi:hypothetical protein